MTNTEIIYSGEDTIKEILQLVRYDIPILIVGKSSIGKSYTVIDVTKKWRIPNQILYIGSEKAENIEGIPKITQRKEEKEQLEYLQPYWFPNGAVITKSVANGYELYKKFIKTWKPSGGIATSSVTKKYETNFDNLMAILNALSYVKVTNEYLQPNGNYELDIRLVSKSDDNDKSKDVTLTEKPFKFIVEPEKVVQETPVAKGKDETTKRNPTVLDEYHRDDLRDLSIFLTTALGWGNYWLILDEIDKVDALDKDKFAPLLHIVRERTLKNFRMVEINNGEGLGIPLSLKNGGYEGIIKKIALDLENNQSVLDTRVLAVANESKNIDQNNDALFRRFVQIIVEEVMIWRKSQISLEQDRISQCIGGLDDKLGDSTLIEDRLLARLSDVNLQWKYNFLPKILNQTDLHNFFVNNYIETMAEAGSEGLAMQATALYKVLKDNYSSVAGVNIPTELFGCLGATIISGEATIEGGDVSVGEVSKSSVFEEELQYSTSAELAFSRAIETIEKFQNAVTKGGDAQLALDKWGNSVLGDIQASLITDDTWNLAKDKDGVALASHLIPRLTQVYFGCLTDTDYESQVNFEFLNAKIQDYQSMWGKIYSKYPQVLDIQMDAGATKQLFDTNLEGVPSLYKKDGAKSITGGIAVKIQQANAISIAKNLGENAISIYTQVKEGVEIETAVKSAQKFIGQYNASFFLESQADQTLEGNELKIVKFLLAGK